MPVDRLTARGRRAASPRPPARAAVVAGVLAVAVYAPARAQTRPAEYEAAYREGTARFERGDYAGARERFEAAYAIHPEPLLLVNIGSTYRREGDLSRALEFYRKFLAVADPDDPYRDEVAALVGELEAEVRSRAGAPQPFPSPPADTRSPEPRPPRSPTATARRAQAAPPPSRFRALRTAGWIAAGVGALAVGVAVHQGLRAREIERDLEGVTGAMWTDDLQARYDAGQRAEARAVIFGIAGGVAAAAGAALLLWPEGARTTPSVSVTAAPANGRIGVAVSGRF